MKIKSIQIGKQFFIPDLILENENGEKLNNRDFPVSDQIKVFYRLANSGERRNHYHFSHIHNKKQPNISKTNFTIENETLVSSCVLKIENLEVIDKGKAVQVSSGQDLVKYHAESIELMSIFNQTFNKITASDVDEDEVDEDFLT